MRIANEGYITIRRFDLYGEKAIPTGRVEADKAEFLLISGQNPERKIWLRREEIS